MSRRTAIYLLLVLVALGLGLRVYQLTARSLWFDEAFSWRLIQFPLTEMVARDAADVHPPLYYIVLKGWSTVFATSLLSLRSFSVLMAGFTILTSYLFTAGAFRSRTTGLIAAALLTFSGFQIQYAWEARMYTLGTALVFLSSWLLIKALRQQPQRFRLWLAYAVVTALFAYIHYYAFFSIAAQVVFLAGYLLVVTRGRIGEIVQWRLTWLVIAAGAIMTLLYLPWIPIFLAQNSQVQQAYWIPPIGGWSIPDTFYRMFAPTAGIPRHTGLGWIALAATPVTLTVIGWLLLVVTDRRTSKPTRDATWLVMLSGSVPFLLSILLSFGGQSLYQDRFFVFAHLFIIIGLAALLNRLRPNWLSYAVSLTVVLASLIAFLSYWSELDIVNRPGAHAATRTIFESSNSAEPIIVSSPFIYFAVLHYAEEEFNVPRSVTPAGHTLATPKLYSETGELAHFAGGPILTAKDIVGPAVFENPDLRSLWIVDTTGFGSTKLQLPPEWQPETTLTFPEVFAHQADVFVTRYVR